MIPLCRDMGVALIPWSPLARGFLAGNRTAQDTETGRTTRAKTDAFAQKLYYREQDFAVVDRLSEVASARGESNARIAYAWLLHQPGLSAPIVGSSKISHIEDAVAATGIQLSAEEIKPRASCTACNIKRDSRRLIRHIRFWGTIEKRYHLIRPFVMMIF
jgi:aryl-alcohol dehydrogenase-like predicted oxidoreductase